jgi:hypothetical protein
MTSNDEVELPYYMMLGLNPKLCLVARRANFHNGLLVGLEPCLLDRKLCPMFGDHVDDIVWPPTFIVYKRDKRLKLIG